MPPTITSEVVVAYARCPRKAYLLLYSPGQGEPHEYVRILEQQRHENQTRYLDRLRHKHADVHPYTVENLRNGNAVLLNACLQADGLAAVCDALTRVEGQATRGQYRYEPTMCVGTHSISKEQKLALAFTGYVLGRLQHTPPMAGRLIAMDGTSHTVTLEKSAADLVPLLEPLQVWTSVASPKPPPVILNKHCPLCPFQRSCQAQAEQEDNLSLLAGVTARGQRQYEKKGIFTVKQLSYLFKPRKRKKRSRKPPPITPKLELQALAIRENKIYLQELPTVSRQPVELFVDMEGLPDRGLYYLIGLLVCQADAMTHYAFWADTVHEERHIWQQFVHTMSQYPEGPIYHYGSYEPRAIATLTTRYQTDSEHLTKRLVNVNSYIYGKVYFPVRSNGLKDIGHYIGAQWTSPNASGLQSLVWRHQWESTQDETYKDLLLTYNAEDCRALQLLTDELSRIKDSVGTLSEVDFANQPKRQTTAVTEEVHSQFETMRKFAHTNYDKTKIKFKLSTQEDGEPKNENIEKSTNRSRSKRRVRPKPDKIVQVEQREICPIHKQKLTTLSKQISKRLVIDLVLMRNGIKKIAILYKGVKEYCPLCKKYYVPPDIVKYWKAQLYGHGFKSWIIYQRVALRLSYGNLIETMKEHFHEKIPIATIPNAMQDLCKYYAKTEELIAQRILESPFIHADETTINIKGVGQYVWIFTDGKQVIFRLCETREATIVHNFLIGYQGVLISDFYAGYDSIPCKQQKCWVHLIRDLNGALWENPFDTEFETFVVEVRNLIIPIMEAVQKYGLKERNLNKFIKPVENFYQSSIDGKHYKSESTIKYQERFRRYRQSLFTFLEQDGIPWHNNTAENAIRHLAIQRDMSTHFCEGVAHDYLVLLGIQQTCRFQDKSFFKFLFSGETDLEKFEAHKRKQ